MDSFGDILFRGEVKDEQARQGTAERFEKFYAHRGRDGLGPDEVAFIQSRTTFYMATGSETGWPYVQHRGGPPGFLKVFGSDRLGMADYLGNRQYVSTGHLKAGSKISLILMDYPRKARLKILGEASMIDASEDPDLAAQLAVDGQGPVERLLQIDVVAFDWNCPKYITERFTMDEVAAMVGPRISELEARIKELEGEHR
jgi:predicted pyridoxine 5'-phosphate oxidase superfamily flavin-nucleotide-binding protein